MINVNKIIPGQKQVASILQASLSCTCLTCRVGSVKKLKADNSLFNFVVDWQLVFWRSIEGLLIKNKNKKYSKATVQRSVWKPNHQTRLHVCLSIPKGHVCYVQLQARNSWKEKTSQNVTSRTGRSSCIDGDCLHPEKERIYFHLLYIFQLMKQTCLDAALWQKVELKPAADAHCSVCNWPLATLSASANQRMCTKHTLDKSKGCWSTSYCYDVNKAHAHTVFKNHDQES